MSMRIKTSKHLVVPALATIAAVYLLYRRFAPQGIVYGSLPIEISLHPDNKAKRMV